MNLGEKIFELRTQNNLSQGDLADRLDVSRQSVSKWENNTAVPDLDKLIKMSDVFGASLDELVGREKPQKRAKGKLTDFKKSHTKTQYIGCILAAITLLCLIVPLGQFFAFSFGACAIICLFVKKYAWYWCIWAWYLPIQIFVNYMNTNWAPYIMEAVFLVAITVVACICLKEFVFKVKNKKAWLGFSVAYVLIYTVFLCFAPQLCSSFDFGFGIHIDKFMFAIINAFLTLIMGVTIVYIINFIREVKYNKRS